MAGYDLKNEEDVKLYIQNLYTEYKFGCYGEKKPEGERTRYQHNLYWY